MNRILRAALVGAIATGALVTATTTPAFAATPRGLEAIQAAGKAQTDSRIAAINAAIPKVTGNAYLTASDRSTILGTLNADRSAMQALQSKIAGDTDAAAAAADYQSIFTGYRVFAVAIPQSLYAASADGLVDSAIPALVKAQSTLQAALAGPLASKSTPDIQAKMADLATQIGIAQKANGQSAAALAVTPSGYNANHSILEPVRTTVQAAAAAAKAGAADVQAIKAALQ